MVNQFTIPIFLGEDVMPPRIDLSRPVVNPRKRVTKNRTKIKAARKQNRKNKK